MASKMSWIAVLIALLAPLGASGSEQRPEVADDVFASVRQARVASGLPGLERRPELDAVALDRAREVAARPPARRLSGGETIGRRLLKAGVKKYRRAFEHLDLKRGYPNPAEAFAETWRSYQQAWDRALAPHFTAIGVASVVADDGWIVLVAVLIEDRKPPPDLESLATRALQAVNDVRREHGLPPLQLQPMLAEVAGSHSRDMARYGYFSHESIAGLQPEDRVKTRRVRYRKIAENIQKSRGVEDPVRAAVESWMSSPGHRRNILDPDFTRTGVGVAIDYEETFYFTQLFLQPPAAGH